jgi:putative phosphoesterase
MQVAIVSDTHVPSRADRVPAWVADEIEAADHTLHAGDFDDVDTYERIVELADGELTAVHGNMDPGGVDLPSVETVELDGVEFVLTHGTGDRAGYERRVARTVAEYGGEDAIGVSGHTHEVMDRAVDGHRLLNPGSATGASPADRTTMMVAEVSGGEVAVTVRQRAR